MLLKKARLIPFGFYSPYENMAIDEYLARFYAETRIPVIRFYSWKPEGLSIGRHQDISNINIELLKTDKVPFVRRITGGGAIFHADEVTYSMCFHESDFGWDNNTGVKESYRKLNSFIVKALDKSGIKAGFACDCGLFKGQGRSEICYEGFEAFDITANGKKLGGNAQFRSRDLNAVIQHGSIPLVLRRDAEKYISKAFGNLPYTSVNELLGRAVGHGEIYSNLIACFIETTGLDIYEHDLEMDEKKEIVKLMTEKYVNRAWNEEGRI